MHDQPEGFEELRRLLALKRHEVPPPGYFESFSDRVVARVQADSAASSRGVIRRITTLFQARPAISWSFCMASVLVLFAATTLFETEQGNRATGAPTFDPAFVSAAAPAAPASASGVVFTTNQMLPRSFAFESVPATNAPPSESLFGAPFYMRVEPVSFNR